MTDAAVVASDAGAYAEMVEVAPAWQLAAAASLVIAVLLAAAALARSLLVGEPEALGLVCNRAGRAWKPAGRRGTSVPASAGQSWHPLRAARPGFVD